MLVSHSATHEHDRRAPALEELSAAAGSEQLRRAYGCAPSGVALVAADVDGRPGGLLVSTLTSVSLAPPLLSICVQRASRSWSLLRRSRSLGVSVLGDQHESVCDQLAGPWDERLTDVAHATTPEGAVLLADAGAWFTCTIHDELEAGDHTLVLLRIQELTARPRTQPLIFHGSRYRRVTA